MSKAVKMNCKMFETLDLNPDNQFITTLHMWRRGRKRFSEFHKVQMFRLTASSRKINVR